MVGPTNQGVNEPAPPRRRNVCARWAGLSTGARRVLGWGLLLAAVAVVLDFVPLLDLLGYDFSFAVGLVAAFAAADIGHGVATGSPAAARPVAALAARAVAMGLVPLAAPLLLSLANAVRVRNCNLGAGLAFYALLPASTALFAAPAGLLAGLALGRRGRAVALLLPLASIVWTLLRLYRDPPVFAYDPFGGYFPGPIYDEAMRPPLRLLVFRLVNLTWIATAVAVAAALRARAHRRRLAVIALLLAAASTALYARGGSLGFHVTAADLRRSLDGERRSRHFVLRYATAAGRSAPELDLDMADLEFRYRQLAGILGVEPERPVTVWQFPSTAVKKDLVGAASTLYAKPWTGEMFVQAVPFPAGRLRHELAHVFAGRFGDGFFGVSLAWHWKGLFPVPRLATGLVEGLAEAVDFGDPDGPSTLHQEARAMIADGRAPPLAEIVGAGFTVVSGARAYTLAGSFCRFLLDTRGAEKLRAVYRSAGDFDRVYGAPLPALEAEWKRFLATVPLADEDRAVARERFRRPAIFAKVCAREQAARVVEARGVLGTDPSHAVRLLEQVCRDDPAEPTYRLALAEALAAAGRPAPAMDVLGALRRAPETTDPMRVRVALLESRVAFHAGDLAGAVAALRRVWTTPMDEADWRQVYARARALAVPDTLGRALLGDVRGEALDPVLVLHLVEGWAREHGGDALGPYLVGRQLAGRDAKLALAALERACGPEAPVPLTVDRPQIEGASFTGLPPAFHRECLRMAGEAAFRARDYERSRLAWERLRDEAPGEAERLRATDFIERLGAVATGTESTRTDQ